jgi:hypothetical protein
MANAFFISETYLKDNSPLSGNVDISEIYPFAKSAEEMYIQEAIGTPLFDRLVTAVNAQSYTAAETALLKKIRSCMVWYTVYDAIPFIDTKIRNIGLVQQGGENLQNVSDQKMRDLRKICKDKGDFYLKMLQKYLCENHSTFQEYCCAEWNCSELTPNPHVSNSSDLAIDRNASDYGYDTEFARKWLNGN